VENLGSCDEEDRNPENDENWDKMRDWWTEAISELAKGPQKYVLGILKQDRPDWQTNHAFEFRQE
jgi:hypothetical protein